MVFMLIDDWVYMEKDGKVGIYGRQEFSRFPMGTSLQVQAAFLEYQTKHIKEDQARGEYTEALIQADFDEDFILAQEVLPDNSIQVMGAKKSFIKGIYDFLKDYRVQRLVPYGIALRALLRSREMLRADQSVIFLDDLKNQALLTIFKGGMFNVSRRISMRDRGYLISEIKRSWQAFNDEGSYVIVSNNQEWLAGFIEEGFLSKERLVHLEAEFPVLEGLKSAQFAVHFAPIDQILKDKKRIIWRERLKVIGFSLILLGTGFAIYLSVLDSRRKEDLRESGLKRQENLLTEQLKNAYQQKFLSLLRQDKPVGYARLYYDLVSSISSQWIIDEIRFVNNAKKGWIIQGDIMPQDSETLEEGFKPQGLFTQASTAKIILKQRLGKRVSLQLDQGRVQ